MVIFLSVILKIIILIKDAVVLGCRLLVETIDIGIQVRILHLLIALWLSRLLGQLRVRVVEIGVLWIHRLLRRNAQDLRF